MRRRNLLVMIAAVVAAWPIAIAPAAAAPPSSKAAPPGALAARVAALIRTHSANVEIVGFADSRLAPVRVVRGGRSSPPPVRRATQNPATSDSRTSPVRVVRGGTEIAVAALAPTAPSQAWPADHSGIEIVSFADPRDGPVAVLRGSPPILPPPAIRPSAIDLFAAPPGADLDRIAFAVDGAESSHGADPRMWRAEWRGPQGPMQISAAAALDSGGGDRFDPAQNRLLGRAYLARLFGRYGNWPDAVAAYNWGPGNMDMWIGGGRAAAGFPLEIERYRDRVLRDGGLR